MECSICYNEINAATGKVELSCSHPFHFSCLAKWFDKQRLGGACESCPLCRHDMTDFEKMPDVIVEESDDDTTVDGDVHDAQQENQLEDTTPQGSIDRMQRESVAVGNVITGPVGVWRKTRYGGWIMVSQRN